MTGYAPRPRGRCTECGRVLAGRTEGVNRDYVALPPHVNRRRRVCLPSRGRRVVPALPERP